jgi:alkylation response protein AidB-like acyl-CoA dehydrogenase
MDFDLSSDQKMIVQTVADFVKKQLPVGRMRKMRADDRGWSPEVWKQMGELGWLGISLPDTVGGFGGRFVDAALVLEQLGTTLVSEPYTESAVVAGHLLHAAGSSEQHERWLAPMVAGDTSLAVAWAEPQSRYDVGTVETHAEKGPEGWRLRGEKRWVLNGHAADQLIVSAATGDGLSLFVVEAGDAGVRKQVVKTMDGRRAAMVAFDCRLPSDRLLGEAGSAARHLSRAFDLGAASACAEGYGVMKTSLEMTVEYLKTREQFGVKIGSFQALQHRCVDMFVETELARSLAIQAAIRADEPDDLERKRAVSAAKAHMAVSGKVVTQQAIQLHGGIGITDEHDIGLYFKRMHALNVLWGDEEHHVRRFASLPSFGV